MDPRLKLIVLAFGMAFAFVVLHQLFATAWSNRCDPGNAQFYVLKNDPIVGYQPDGALLRLETDSPDNGWMCVAAGLRIDYVGVQVGAMFDAMRAELPRDGWVGGEIFLKHQDFVVFEKNVNGVRLDAIVNKETYGLELNLDAPPGPHLGEPGFSRP